MTFAKCNKLCNKFNNNNNNIMKILQIAKTCANSRKKKLIKMWENYATIMHTTNYPIAPLLLLLFLLPCGASLSCFQKTRRFLVTESRKWGEIVICLPTGFLGKKCWAMEDAHMWTPSSSSSSSSSTSSKLFIALKTLKNLPWKGTKSIFSGAQYMILHIKIGWRKVKTCRFGSGKWFF